MKLFLLILLLATITTKTLSFPNSNNNNENNNGDIASLYNNWLSQEQTTSFCTQIKSFINNSSQRFIQIMENITNNINSMLGMNSAVSGSNHKKSSAATSTTSTTTITTSSTTLKPSVEIVDNNENPSID
ncbi:GATA zinc finger domain-containing protein 18-like [Calliphora vicina]|uniref:GATA zinc finger domain-containing protein 18-like n=1 Tax=Calliphora vicina TaxID=7373 RepID=UPI00325A89FD